MAILSERRADSPKGSTRYVRYRENMQASSGEDTVVPFPESRQERARQWRRISWAMAALFGTLPLMSRLFLGSWSFDGALGIAMLFVVLAAYFHLLSHKFRQLPDDATLLERGINHAREGRTDEAIHLFSRAIRLSPRLWQAHQYRGELYLLDPVTAKDALRDFNAAIEIAPAEAHLFTLRARANALLGDGGAARRDLETGARNQAGLYVVPKRIEGSPDE